MNESSEQLKDVGRCDDTPAGEHCLCQQSVAFSGDSADGIQQLQDGDVRFPAGLLIDMVQPVAEQKIGVYSVPGVSLQQFIKKEYHQI